MGLALAESTNFLVSLHKPYQDVPMTFRRILPTFDTGFSVGELTILKFYIFAQGLS
jgi:hypothetical protein